MNESSRDKFLRAKKKLEERDLLFLKEIEAIEAILSEDKVGLSFHICNDVWWTVRDIVSRDPGYGFLSYAGSPIRFAGRATIKEFLAKIKTLDLYTLAFYAYNIELEQ